MEKERNDFEYENSLEHQIFLWPKNLPEYCKYCDQEGHHKTHSCVYCGKCGCRYGMIYDKDYLDWFCDETCLDRQLTKDGFKKEEDSNAGV